MNNFAVFSFLLLLPMIYGLKCPGDDALNCSDDNLKDGAVCKQGEADYTLHEFAGKEELPWLAEKSSPNGYHCNCEVGYTGLNCFRKFESCTNDESGELENVCYYGGSCVAGVLDEFGNKQHYCDCSGAKLSDEEGGDKTIGKFCQDPVNQCKEGHAFGRHYCLNGAQCHTDSDGNFVPGKPCNKCKDGFFGMNCEFSSEENMNAKCDLPCTENGKCVRGFKDFHQARMMFNQGGFFEETDYMYCECNDGFDGPFCEQNTKQVISEGKSCGEDGKECKNGGVCIKDPKDSTKDICDCSTAKNATHYFGGKYCMAVQSDKCNDPDIKSQIANGKLFCYNGGTCDAAGAHMPCNCDDGKTGATCEINIGQGETKPTESCDLKCENGGNCRFGTKDTGSLTKFGADLEMFTQKHIDLRHCVCPDGFVGAKCEFKVDVCGSGEHICFHDSKCVKDSNDPSGYTCDCSSAKPSDAQYSGKYCHKTAEMLESESKNSGKSGFEKFLISVIVILSIVLAGFFYLKRKHARTQKRLEAARYDRNTNIAPADKESSAENGNGAPVLDMGPAKDIDGNTFDNVEII